QNVTRLERARDRAVLGRERRDAAGAERRDAYVAGAVHAERIQELEARKTGKERAAVGQEPGRRLDVPRPGHLPPPDTRRVGLGDIEARPVRREPHPVRGIERKDDLADLRPVGLGVEDAASVAGALLAEPVVGEVETPLTVEYEIVRCSQRPARAFGVQNLDLARADIDPLDP